jgi:hypothetical protein
MNKQKRDKIKNTKKRCCISNKMVGNKEVVIVDYAVEYVKKQGYEVKKACYLIGLMLIVMLSIGTVSASFLVDNEKYPQLKEDFDFSAFINMSLSGNYVQQFGDYKLYALRSDLGIGNSINFYSPGYSPEKRASIYYQSGLSEIQGTGLVFDSESGFIFENSVFGLNLPEKTYLRDNERLYFGNEQFGSVPYSIYYNSTKGLYVEPGFIAELLDTPFRFGNPVIVEENLTAPNICYSDGTNCTASGGSGNPFDQELNKSDDVNFNSVTTNILNSPDMLKINTNLTATQGATFLNITTENGRGISFKYSPTVARYPELHFNDASNTKIGIAESTYFAFINDYSDFWLGISSDPSIYINYYNGDDVFIGSDGINDDVKVTIDSILKLNTNSTTVNCNTANRGSIIYSGGKHWGCGNTGWSALY